jgi:hypothetical protein
MTNEEMERLLWPIGELLLKETRYQAELARALKLGEPYGWRAGGERHELTDKKDIAAWKNIKFHQANTLRYLLRRMAEDVPATGELVRGYLAQANQLIKEIKEGA